VTGGKIAQKIAQIRLDLLGEVPLTLYENAHLGKAVNDLLSKYEREVSPHAPRSHDMSPPDFDLLHKLQKPTCGHRVHSLVEVSAAVSRAIRKLKKKGHPKWNSKSSETLWRGHWEAGGYIEGL
jgi:hypothetical protein